MWDTNRVSWCPNYVHYLCRNISERIFGVVNGVQQSDTMNALMERTFAEAVEEALKRRGLTLRSQRRLTGIAHSTLMNWLQDTKPSMEAVIQFARGLKLDEAEYLRLAGYEAAKPSPADVESCAYLLIDQIKRDPAQARPWAEQIVAEYRATYEATPTTPTSAPEPSPSVHPNPLVAWVDSQLATLKAKYIAERGYIAPKAIHGRRWGIAFSHNENLTTQAEADQVVQLWLQALAVYNPTKPDPDELL
jgi:lambda repressor-like predicted transcriptional regulator